MLDTPDKSSPIASVWSALLGAVVLGLLNTLGDFIWATFVQNHRMIFGLLHGMGFAETPRHVVIHKTIDRDIHLDEGYTNPVGGPRQSTPSAHAANSSNSTSSRCASSSVVLRAP